MRWAWSLASLQRQRRPCLRCWPPPTTLTRCIPAPRAACANSSCDTAHCVWWTALGGPPLATYFQRFELELIHALKPSDGLAQLATGGFDAAILDVMLPEMDGFELCRTIRKQGDLPIVMLTARGGVMDRVVGLELGADDYLPKPFEPRELVARLQTVLRRRRASAPGNGSGAALEFEGLSIDAARRSVLRQGVALELTGTEFALLHLLARGPGRVFSGDDIPNQRRGHEDVVAAEH